MKKFLMIASAAAMAVAMPAIAKPDGNGNGKGNGGGHAAHNAGGGKPEKVKGNSFRAEKASNSGWKQAEKVQKQSFNAAERSAKAENKAVERGRIDNERFDGNRFRSARTQNGLAANRSDCPPGLDKKNNGCLPPGQAKKMDIGQRFQSDWFRSASLPYDYRDLLSDNDRYYYRYDDNGYIYRVDRGNDMIAGLIPLLGGGFQVGQALPAGYDAYNVPLQFRDTYFDGDDLMYRFGDNAIYQVDPQTRTIESVVALLTGNNFSVGQQMPAGYDMYNLPYQYRDQYYDTDQYNYRYADGNIFQIDPTTQIVQAVIGALI